MQHSWTKDTVCFGLYFAVEKYSILKKTLHSDPHANISGKLTTCGPKFSENTSIDAADTGFCR